MTVRAGGLRSVVAQLCVVVGACAHGALGAGCDSTPAAPPSGLHEADVPGPADDVSAGADADGVVGADGVDGGEVASAPIVAGNVVWRRLNRTEYRNTVRDLLGTALDPGKDLPSDDLGYGFDNVASVLTMSPLHLELYERAARSLAGGMAPIPPTGEPPLGTQRRAPAGAGSRARLARAGPARLSDPADAARRHAG